MYVCGRLWGRLWYAYVGVRETLTRHFVLAHVDDGMITIVLVRFKPGERFEVQLRTESI